MKRAVLGTLSGALFGGVIAAAIPLVLCGAVLLFVDVHPMDRKNDLERFPYIVTFCGISGIIVGALAGLASRLPASGVPFLRCCIYIALAAGVVRLFTAPRTKVSDADQFLSYIASFVAAVIVTRIMIWVGLNRGSATRRNGLSK